MSGKRAQHGAQNTAQQSWIVRDDEGKIYGPFATGEVLEQIDKGYFIGREHIATYPGGDWVPITRAPQFADRLLDALAAELKSRPQRDPSTMIAEAGGKTPLPEPRQFETQQLETQQAETQPDDVDPESTDRRESKGRTNRDGETEDAALSARRVDAGVLTADVRQSALLKREAGQTEQKPNQSYLQSGAERSVATAPESLVELTDLKDLERKEQAPRSKLPLFLLLTAVGLAAVALLPGNDQPTEASVGIRLLAPRSGQPELPEPKIREKLKRAQLAFQKDLFSGYVRAQNELVEVVEGAPVKPESTSQRAEWLASLCMTYRELWPYSRQDAVDLATVGAVTREAKKFDPGGRHGTTCEIIQQMLSGRSREAEGLTESMLVEEGQVTALFEIRGDLYLDVRDYRSAVGYFNQARGLWPAWKKTAIQEARAHVGLEQYPTAIELYNEVLRSVPTHAIAKVELGLIEGLQFSHLEKGFELLKSAIEGKEKLPTQQEARALYGLAQIYDRRGDRKMALDFARRAFKVNSGLAGVKEMIVRLSGSTTEVATSDPRGLLYLGEQYLRAGDCVAAQAEFKAAFEADPKSGVAAMKAGKCLWELNQSAEAIEWLRKATVADPKLIAAYVMLADYHALRFDFQAAVQVLRQAQRIQPKSYEIFRGFAVVELRRNNFKGAEAYSQRALKLYETDVESNLTMAKAQLGLRNFQEAQRYADRSIELDYNRTEAHILRARAEAGVHGVDAAALYLRSLINRYVLSKGQQIPQAAIDYRVALGEIYLQDERANKAEEVYTEAVGLNDRSKQSLLGLAKALQVQGRQAQALEYFLKAAVLDPSDADPIFQSGLLYLEVGKFKEAQSQFERVLKINDRYPRARVQLARVFLRQGEAKRALEEAMAERALNPELADGYMVAAEAYFSLKQFTNCAAEYQQAARRVRSADVLVRMARCYRLAGALDSAESLLRQAVSIESGHPDLYKERGAIYHMKGMADEAVAAYDTYLKLVPGAPDKAEIEMRIQRVQSGDLTVGN